MSASKVETVRRMYDAFHSGDAERALAHFHPDVLVDVSRRMDGEVGRGHDVLSREITKWVGTFEDWNEEVEEMREHGDTVLVVAVQRGRGKGSGIEVKQRYAVAYDVEGDRITRMAIYPSADEAAEDTGLAG